MTDNLVTIYYLAGKDGIPRYVGCTKNPDKRLKGKYSAKVQAWKDRTPSVQLIPIMKVTVNSLMFWNGPFVAH